MNPVLKAVRAIASELAGRIYKPIVIIASIIGVLLIGLAVWLVSINTWWLLLAAIIFILLVVVTLLLVIAGIVIRLVSPRPTKAQKAQVASFVNKIQHLSEITQTPKVVLLFRAVQDIMLPSNNGFIQSVIGETTSLRKDFSDLLKTFQ